MQGGNLPFQRLTLVSLLVQCCPQRLTLVSLLVQCCPQLGNLVLNILVALEERIKVNFINQCESCE